jgi:hypothetical protein
MSDPAGSRSYQDILAAVVKRDVLNNFNRYEPSQMSDVNFLSATLSEYRKSG